ncbi:SDR family oxidoreductase [Lentilactobacillus sp. Marseille-Q4993]|uniref:SDR family oxidoreductase n=1 Tax=Lentilactobacillus sp. Marseille-Q4993 TaxID=3039492 RepID=UPI0024BC1E96|nr:SDR family oxidoreductase [Lentilactobacillus sp. Marseille-Q4993]
MAGLLLENKRIVIMGITNQSSLAWGIAQVAFKQGAEVILTYQNERIKKQLLKFIPEEVSLYQCDVSKAENVRDTFATIMHDGGRVQGIVHAIAYANPSSLQGEVMDINADDFMNSELISSYSLISVAKYGKELLELGGSIVTLTYIGAHRAVPNYNLMGIAKASLESIVVYLARDLGKHSIRINAVSAGPVKTLSLTGIKNYQSLLHNYNERTIDGKPIKASQIGNVVLFLLSTLSSGMTGDVMYVDWGIHLQ